MPRHDIQALEREVRTLRQILLDLSKPDDFEELVQIWRKPGWTTPAEFTFVAGQIDAMVGLSKQLVEMKQVLLRGSQQVAPQGALEQS